VINCKNPIPNPKAVRSNRIGCTSFLKINSLYLGNSGDTHKWCNAMYNPSYLMLSRHNLYYFRYLLYLLILFCCFNICWKHTLA